MDSNYGPEDISAQSARSNAGTLTGCRFAPAARPALMLERKEPPTMPALNHDHHAGLVLSIASSLESPHPAARKARKHGARDSAQDLDALLAELLTASDDAGLYPDDACLDAEWDE